MKSLLAVAGTIINYSSYALAYPNPGNHYYCGKTKIDSYVVERGRNHACLSLSGSPWWVEFPAALDGSKLFEVKDATLFSWPLHWESVNEVQGRSAGNLRVVIDSMCKLAGVVYRINDSYQKCIQPLSPQVVPTLSLELSLRNPVNTYGIDCNGFVFFDIELNKAYDSLNHYFRTMTLTGEFKAPGGFLQSHMSNELGNEMLWSWPVQFVNEKQPAEIIRDSVFRITINRLGKKRGMIYKIEGEWRRCIDIRYSNKIPSTAFNKHKTSVGEDFLYIDSNFKCGDQIITTHTINSHMQAACPRVQALVKSGNMNDLLYPWSPPEISYKLKPIWYWPIRKPELSSGQERKVPQNYQVRNPNSIGIEADNTKHQLISLGSNCELLGVFYLVNDRKTECQKLVKPNISLGLRTKSATLEPDPKRRKLSI